MQQTVVINDRAVYTGNQEVAYGLGLPFERRAKAFTMNDGRWSMMVTAIEKYLAQYAT